MNTAGKTVMFTMFRNFLPLFPILLILLTCYLSTCAYSAIITPPFEHIPDCKINAITCKNIKCTLGLKCEMQQVVCKTEPCCPVPTCYDPCERVFCPVNYCSELKGPPAGTVCALRYEEECPAPIGQSCCPKPVCEAPIKCNQTDCDIRCRGTKIIVPPTQSVECNTGCACD